MLPGSHRPASVLERCSNNVQSPLFRPECVAAPRSIQPCFSDSSQSRINHSAVCVNGNTNLSLPFSAANLDICFFKGIVYNLHWLDRFSPSWFSKRTTWSDMRTAINGFSVMLNKQNWELGLNEATDCAAFASESHTGSS